MIVVAMMVVMMVRMVVVIRDNCGDLVMKMHESCGYNNTNGMLVTL